VTILFDNSLVLGGQFPGSSRGAVDRSWNKDGFADSTPPFLQYPAPRRRGRHGVCRGGAAQRHGRDAGSFISFDSTPYSRIVRTLPNGYQDPTFLVAPTVGNDYMTRWRCSPTARSSSVAISPRSTATTAITSRLNYDGSVDPSFDPGSGERHGDLGGLELRERTNHHRRLFHQLQWHGGEPGRAPQSRWFAGSEFYRGHLSGTNVVVNAVALDAAGRVLIAAILPRWAAWTAGRWPG